MTFQEVLTALVVVTAAIYLVRKLGFSSSSREKKGPDVPVSALTRKRDERDSSK